MKMYLLFNCSTPVSLHFYLQMLLVIDLFQGAFSASHQIKRKIMMIFLPGFINSFAKIASKTLVPTWNEILS